MQVRFPKAWCPENTSHPWFSSIAETRDIPFTRTSPGPTTVSWKLAWLEEHHEPWLISSSASSRGVNSALFSFPFCRWFCLMSRGVFAAPVPTPPVTILPGRTGWTSKRVDRPGVIRCGRAKPCYKPMSRQNRSDRNIGPSGSEWVGLGWKMNLILVRLSYSVDLRARHG